MLSKEKYIRRPKGKIFALVILAAVFVAVVTYCIVFYPKQSMPVGVPVNVTTPQPEKYHNDCLHPCIRYDRASDTFFMVQSPYYGWDRAMENPVFYQTNSINDWENGVLISDTPLTGYNSDPCFFLDDNGDRWIFWRECYTPSAFECGSDFITVGGKIIGDSIDFKRVFLCNSFDGGDFEQCPIFVKIAGKYRVYASWYQYEPERINKGIAIWEGTALDRPDFKIIDTVSIRPCYTVDKLKQISLPGEGMVFIPKYFRHDMWHFDLFEYDGQFWMVSVAEKGDNIMLSVSDDYKHFKTFFTPLINNHFSETKTGYMQYYYKPTAFVQNDTLYLFYTANAKDDPNRNQLFLSKELMRNIENAQ